MKDQLEEPWEQSIKRIIATAQPPETREDLGIYFQNIRLIIKRAYGMEITDEEIANLKTHPMASFYKGWKIAREVGESFERRISLIERYQIRETARIFRLLKAITYFPPFPVEKTLNTRKIKILLELYQDPLISKTQLSKKFGFAPRTITKEMDELKRYFQLGLANDIDPHRFKLKRVFVSFRTKSHQHSKLLEKQITSNYPLFLRRLAFDENYQTGYLAYIYPDQPKANQLFTERIQGFQDDFFEEHCVTRYLGFSTFLSFDTYDEEYGTWLLEPYLVSEALIKFVKDNHHIFTLPKGIQFSQYEPFTQLDFLLSQLAMPNARNPDFDWMTNWCHKEGFKLAKKTIRARYTRLRLANAFYPYMYLRPQSFEAWVFLRIKCPSEIMEDLLRLPSMLPFGYQYATQDGMVIFFPIPSRCGVLAGHLLYALTREEGIHEVELIRPGMNPGGQVLVEAYSRWDEARQRWIVKEGDF